MNLGNSIIISPDYWEIVLVWFLFSVGVAVMVVRLIRGKKK